MVFKSNLLLIKFSLLVLLMIFSEVAARDMPPQPSHPLLKSNEAQDTTGTLNHPIKPQLWTLNPTIGPYNDLAVSYCLECNCCNPDEN
uniref:HT-like protein n=1 Tax=Nicotiana bonariensis TaxID=118694 RepID=B1Q4I8_9SOLA|nr:HT-like protein [Nicotiana bonariensis]